MTTTTRRVTRHVTISINGSGKTIRETFKGLSASANGSCAHSLSNQRIVLASTQRSSALADQPDSGSVRLGFGTLLDDEDVGCLLLALTERPLEESRSDLCMEVQGRNIREKDQATREGKSEARNPCRRGQ